MDRLIRVKVEGDYYIYLNPRHIVHVVETGKGDEIRRFTLTTSDGHKWSLSEADFHLLEGALGVA